MWSPGAGSDLMNRTATPVIGRTKSFLLELLICLVAFYLCKV
jgi:hypothetical protein